MIGYAGSLREFQARVRPELCRCAMLGLKVADSASRVQSRINKVVATQPNPKKAA